MTDENGTKRVLALKNRYLPLLGLLVFIFSFFPAAVESWYAGGVYPFFANSLRIVTYWIPFSLGDFGYVFLTLLMIGWAVQGLIFLYKKQFVRSMLKPLLISLAKKLLWGYIIFKLFWGLNYDRLGIAHQLSLEKSAYTKEEVVALTRHLIDQVNTYRRALPDTGLPVRPLDGIYREAFHSYQTVAADYPFLSYRHQSVKSSVFTQLGDYMGFSGYYNPFTGEAQLRTDIPRILIPYITCHEMAHQLGYASESEANFVGYLAASASNDPYFLYSVYLDLFSYAQGEEIRLFGQEKDFHAFENIIKENRLHLDSLVKKDRLAIRTFFSKRKNRVSPLASNLYDQFLKMNKQGAGIQSYNDVVGWLIAYQKKYGRL
jgi:hypothetical protein